MTYETLAEAAAATEWGNRLRTALLKAAIDIAVDAPSGSLETRRNTLARQILLEPNLWMERFRLPVALAFIADADLSDVAVTDPEMDSRIAAVFNDFLPPA